MISVTDQQMLAWISALLFPMFRILALMSSAPLLSQRGFPARARVALSGVVAILVAPFTGLPQGLEMGSAPWLELAAREVLIGLAIGFAARLMFTAFEMAGEIIGLQMGLSFAGYFDPAAGQANAVGRTVNALSMLSFVSMNGPLLLLLAVVRSFNVIPIEPGLPTAWGNLSPMQLGADLFALALSLALPFMAMLLFINLVLGVMSRVAPQFNVFAVGFPVTIGSGLVLLSTGYPLLEQPLGQAVNRLLSMFG
jgi:flagellar biosynthesis protein FliR